MTRRENNDMVVGGLRTCKVAPHSSRYPILYEILLALKIHWNNVATLGLFHYVHGIEA